MDRKEELLKSIGNAPNKILLLPLVDKMVFLEVRLEELEKLPFIRVNKNNNEQQKSTPAAKQYKEFLQQYINVIKEISHEVGTDSEQEDSPLRKWVDNHCS